VSFEVAADAYTRFMGRYADPLAEQFVELVGARPPQRALDVGCGPGALTAQLVRRLGAEAVAAVDPSESFLSAARARFPRVDVRAATAEQLPFADDTFDVAAAQLVVHFMADPVSGLREMRRVVRPGGTVAACVWDHAGRGGTLTVFWDAVRDLDPDAVGERDLPGARAGHLEQLSEAAGLHDVEPSTLSVEVGFATFEEWWDPFTLGVGPAGDLVARLDESGRARLRERCEQLLPSQPFTVVATAWCVRARA
jgi:SAM-dependent methyltransferase